MEKKHAVEPRSSSTWTRTIPEIEGGMPPSYRRTASAIFHNSLAEVKIFKHDYLHTQRDSRCPTYSADNQEPLRSGISGLEFNSQGSYLAAITKAGCLIVRNFETLYCTIYGPIPSPLANDKRDRFHIFRKYELNSVRWNPTNQDQVACVSLEHNNVLLFDVTSDSYRPANTFSCKSHSKECPSGLSDVLFGSTDSRLLASCLDGNVYVFDTRLRKPPCLILTTDPPQGAIYSIALYPQDRFVFGAGSLGLIHSWDLRGGQPSHACQSNNDQRFIRPLRSINVPAELEKISYLKAQKRIVGKEIHSININPSCSDQLAFHMVDGRSGVLDPGMML